MQSSFEENKTFPIGSICYGYGARPTAPRQRCAVDERLVSGIMCDNATVTSGACPASSFAGAIVGVFGAFSSTAACTAALDDLATPPLSTSVVSVRVCTTSLCNGDSFIAAGVRMEARVALALALALGLMLL